MEPNGKRKRQMKMQFHLKRFCAVGAILWMAAGAAHAQIGTSVAVGNITPAEDALGRNVSGCWCNSNAASRIEIREFGTGIVKPPATQPEIEAANPLVRETYMGSGVVGTDTGMFSEIFTNRQVLAGKTYYARAFLAPSIPAAIYFTDSLSFQDVPPAQWASVPSIDVVFEPVQLVSGEEDLDTDQDGIPNALEDGVEFSTDSNNPDTDGDGYEDGFEVAHGAYLQPTEPDPNEIRLVSPEAPGERLAVWWSIPDVAYRLEYTDAMTDPEAFTEIWSGTASQTNLEISVEDWITNSPMGFFRWAIP